MPSMTSPASRFRELRERAGLSHDDVANRMRISSACIWDIEAQDDELSSVYSLADLKKISNTVGTTPSELFGVRISEPSVSPDELIWLIGQQCHARKITIEQLENLIGWRLAGYLDSSEQLLKNINVDVLQWLCAELGIDWQRVMSGL
jgi:transcriptional regulator with XRE-family HTH domain